MYHPEASIVRLEQVHGSDIVARGADDIRATMAGCIGLQPHMDVVVHHTTVSGDFALCRSQWRITGKDRGWQASGSPSPWHGGHASLAKRRVGFFIDHPWGADDSWAVDRPPRTR
jgi:ketosteroid isomerase-like protein